MNKKYLLLWVMLVVGGMFAAHAGAHEVSSRAVALADLGLSESVELNTRDSEQHFYMPMPQGVALKKARIDFSAVYAQPFAEKSALTILVNGRPVMTRPLSASATSIDWTLPLADIRTKSAFLDIGVVLSARVDAEHCVDERGRGQVLLIDTRKTKLVYSYENRAVRDIRSMLATLPRHPVILLPGSALNEAQYESALHLAQSLSEMGLQPEFIAIPKLGDHLQTAGMASLPVKWHGVKGEEIRFSTNEEIGAWLRARMEMPNGLAQLVIDPVATRQALLAALRKADSKGAEAWLRHSKEGSNIEVMQLAGYPVLGVGDRDAARGVDLIASEWKQVANSRALELASAVSLTKAMDDVSELHIAKDLPVLQVAANGQWVIPMRLGDLPAGRWPEAFELNLMAAPASDGLSPVASVMLNDNLLTASPLRTDGQMTRITARIPLYALHTKNYFKIQVSRRVEASPCVAVSQTVPVQLLPSSFLSLRRTPAPTQFFMLESLLADRSEVAVPNAYLQDAMNTLPAVSAVLQGLSAAGGDYVLHAVDGGEFAPQRPFVAFEVRPENVSELVTTANGRLVVRDGQDRVVFDSRGLDDSLVMQMVNSRRQPGVYITSVTGRLPKFSQELNVSAGTLVIADAQGVRFAVNLDDPDNDMQLDEQNRGIKLFFHHYRIWFIVLGFLLMPVLVVLALRFYYRRRKLRA